MMVIAIPSKVAALDITWLQSNHFAVLVVLGIDEAPLPVIPLADETAPIFDVQFCSFVANLEFCLLVAIDGGGKKIKPIKTAGRKLDGLPLGDDCVRRTTVCGRQRNCTSLNVIWDGSISAGRALPLPSNPRPAF